MRIFLLYFDGILKNDLLILSMASLIIIIVSYFIAKLLTAIIKKIEKPIMRRFLVDLDPKIASVIHNTIYKIIIFLGFYLALKNFKNSFGLISYSSYRNLISYFPLISVIREAGLSLLYIIFSIVLLMAAFSLINQIFAWYEKKSNNDTSKLSSSLFLLLKKITKILVFSLALVIVLSHFKIDISGLLVSLGVGSLAIALAAQDTLSNMIAGFIIMIDRPFKLGDRVQLTDNSAGDIYEIGFRSTKILNFDGNLVIIPNSEIIKSKLINVANPTKETRVLLNINIDYTSDVNLAKEIINNIAHQNELSIKESIELVVSDLTELGIRLQFTCKVINYADAWKLKCEMNEQILQQFTENKIHFATALPKLVNK